MTTNDLAAIRARLAFVNDWRNHPDEQKHMSYILSFEDTIALCDEVEALRGELARAREVIGWVYAWSQAYPLDVFPEPDKQRAKELLEAGGLTLDAVSASAIRHAVGSIGRDVAAYLRDAGRGEGE